jgi:cyclophilin family peptidyl-prolyl cis-trans isomerase
MCSRSFFTALSLVLYGSGLAEAAKIKPPAEPSNLRVKALGVNSFRLDWKDNSDNETGWEILVALKGGTPARFVLLPGVNLTNYTLSTINNELPGRELIFQIRAYNGPAGKEKFSKKTSVVSATAFPTVTFGAPTRLAAKAVDDGQIRISWKDNATSENGYAMEYKPAADKKWQSLGTAQANTRFSLSSLGFSPDTSYSFRVRAFKGNPAVLTGYSNVATIKTKKFQAPTGLIAKAEADGAFSFKWKENSSIEEGYELHRKIGTGEFAAQGTVGPNSTTIEPVAGYALGTDHQFKLRAFRTVDAKRVYSAFSNTVSIKSTTLTKPSGLVAAAVNDSSIKLDWKDETLRESGYLIKYRKVGTTTFSEQKTAANIKTLTIAKLMPGTSYEFQLSAFQSNFFGQVTASSASVPIQSQTKDGIAGDLNPPIFYGTSFSYAINVSRSTELTDLSVTGLPNGLVFNSGPRTITGTLNEDGVKTITLTASFNSSPTVTRSLILRVVRPPAAPVVTAAFDAVNVAPAANQVVSLTGKFADPDTPSAARVATTKGNFDIILYSHATPATVDNFLDYVDAGRYTDSFFHRSVLNFVVQGGGFKYTSAGGFSAVTKYAAVANEPGVSNEEGTVAMAKVDGQPDSATSQFFVNVDAANPGKLDEQNGGFTVFGRVADAGMNVVDTIAALPRKTYSITGIGSLEDVPMDAATAPAFMEPDKLVKITGVTAAPILTYTVTSEDSAIATASLSGTNVTITGVATGSTTVEVKATDLDGSQITQDISVTVP